MKRDGDGDGLDHDDTEKINDFNNNISGNSKSKSNLSEKEIIIVAVEGIFACLLPLLLLLLLELWVLPRGQPFQQLRLTPPSLALQPVEKESSLMSL